MRLLETEKLTKTFGGLTAVSQVDMHVDSGEILGLIGPNGAGKTTFFNLISGLYQPTAGEIIFQNQRVHGFKGYQMAEAGIARTFQNIRLLSSLSVLENVLLGSYTRGKAGLWGAILKGKRVRDEEKRVRQESMEQLELVGLQDYAHQPAGVLSYGQQRKLEIARALAIYPALLLLDEPTAGMNAEEVEEIMSLVRYLKSHNKTIVLIEHNMHLVMNLCERLIVFDHGEKVASGSPQEIQTNPLVIEAYLGKEGDDE
ncbi:ABC transporter ATP-binding protein [Desulfosporosinus sp. OT]|uniref:ABC transporter ATP-binding protein n=1 Tax=Desulfosporosinus sp. OT TaxID=913865 RepID=UPI000223A194|nr:ABC transporter ATP-binding protein [Desulfosporosinus sp. OT]EGW38504.1 ABC transporter family protein [Desulfosporosinus sp. OT]